MKQYALCGLTVAADLDLPIASVPEASAPDVVVHRAAVPTALPDPQRTGPTWQIVPGRILLQIPGIARFLMTDGREIAYEPDEGRCSRDLEIFLIGSTFGVLLHQRGAFPLRAAAVEVAGHAMLFCGTSGAGKSSLAAALCAAGYPLIADEMCVLQCNGAGRPTVAPEGRGLNLWADVIEHLALQSRCDTAVRPGIRKYWVYPPTPVLRKATPLGAVYFLREETPLNRTGIEPIALLHAVELMRSRAWRTRLVNVLGQEAQWLDFGMSVMRGNVAFRLTRRLSFKAMHDCVEDLERHWRGLDLTTRGKSAA